MTVSELIALLSTANPELEVVLEDLNGLHWKMESSLVRILDDEVILGSDDVNKS